MSQSARPTPQHERDAVPDTAAAPSVAHRADPEFAPRPVAGGLAFGIQRHLAVGSAHDPAEAEAERVATAVVSSLRMQAEAPEDLEHTHADVSVQRMATGTIGLEGGVLGEEAVQELRSAGGGTALEPVLRRRLEGSLGADLSAVRLHEGGTATRLNRSLGAEAFTHGRDVYFRDGLPDTATEGGLHLLAHELTHTVQQGGAPVRRMRKKKDSKGPDIVTLEGLNALIKQFPAIKGGAITLEELGDAKPAAVNAAIAASKLEIDGNTSRASIIGEITTGMTKASKSPAKVKDPLEARKEAAKLSARFPGPNKSDFYYGGSNSDFHVHCYPPDNAHLKLGNEEIRFYNSGALKKDQLKRARDGIKDKGGAADHLHAAIDRALLDKNEVLDPY